MRVTLNRRNAQLIFTAVQALFWLTYGLMFAFASVYLLDRGFSNSAIGLILGCAYLLSVVLQPVLPRLTERLGWTAEQAVRRAYLLDALLSAALLAAPWPNKTTAVLLTVIFALASAVQPFIDTLAHRWTSRGLAVDFGVSRGISSLLYAGMTAGMGLLLERVAPGTLPAFYMGTMLISALLLALLRLPDGTDGGRIPKKRKKAGAPLRRPGFPVLLGGIVCLAFGHVLTDRFLLQIFQEIGGGSQSLGIAMGIAALVEFPVMLLYTRLRRRVGDRGLLVISGWAWLAKHILILLARTPGAVYGAMLLQICSYGLYIPASVQFIAVLFPGPDQLGAQALAGSAYTGGGVLATFLGGILLDAAGVRPTLAVIAAVTLAGALLFTLAARRTAGASPDA